VIFISKLLQIRIKRVRGSVLHGVPERKIKIILSFGIDLVAVKSGNPAGLGGTWGCSWDWGEREVEEPKNPLCCCEICVLSVSVEKKKAVS